LFLDALELDLPARESFLQDACGDDGNLLREVKTLLGAAAESEPYFAGLAEQARLAIIAGSEEPPVADRIGAWRLLRLIGRGGMGAVYLAERADGQYEARAALKILPVGIRDAAARGRFIAERQILARLVHDNITRLLDGGVTDDGTPYFVMDYVEGTSIDAYCDANRLNLEQRLDLILKVCDTVQFAHQNLIVHRDIKPGNVLIDASGTVRLLDFGIAKLLDENDLPAELTFLARRPLTPTYASPEMLLAQPVDVTTDVYSLGVLCYRLLTGRLPLEFRGLSAGEMEERIRGALPIPASQAVLREDSASADEAQSADELAARRRSDPKRLSARLSGDLDVILETALARERERRYASVELLARDIRRYKKGLPIVARRPTVGYRAGKFLRRHRLGIAVAAVAIVTLVGITGLSVRYAVVTERQSREIAAERDRAEEIKDFLQGVFLTAEPSVSKGEELTAREILDRGARRLAGDMHDRPELKADLLDTVADVYQGLGFFAEARPLAEQVVAFRQDAYGESSPQYGDALHKLAYLDERLGDYERALEHSTAAVAVRRAVAQPVKLADSLIVYGRTLHRLGRLDEARPFYIEAVALNRSAFAGADEKLALSLVSLGTLEKARGSIDDAEALQREALQMRLAIYTEPSTELIESHYNLGTILHQRRKYAEARDAYNAALEIGHKLWPQPEGHPDEPYMLNGLARVHESLEEYAEAETLFRQAIATLERHLGDRHPNLGIVQVNLGDVLIKLDGCNAAEPAFSAAVSILSESAPGVAALANAQSRLGLCRLEAGQLDEAGQLLEASFRAHREARGLEHAETQKALSGLIDLFERRGSADRAEEYRAMAVPVTE
jgi:serine/threonine-protein kinase